MNRNTLSLRLTEPVVFLRSGSDSASRRRRRGRAEYPPTLLRGILTLNLTKPTRIKSIEVEFEGISRTDWPDVGGPITARRMDLSEEKIFLSSKLGFFQADQQRRAKTVGPGLHLDGHTPPLLETGGQFGQLACIDEESRGRRFRRESTENRPRQPFSTLNGPPVPRSLGESESARESGDWQRPALGPNLSAPVTYSSEQSGANISGTPALQSQTSHVNARNTSLDRPLETNGTTDRKTSRRRSTRLSLTGMLQEMKDMVQGHPHRHNIEDENVVAENDDLSLKRGRSQGRKEKGAIARIGEVLGIDGQDEEAAAENDPSWREFKPGEYNYPIAFTLSSDLPPSIQAEYGSVHYQLKATVHRPGTFTPNLTASTAVELVVAPAEDDAEEGDAVVIERQWDLELRYMISIGGRNYPQGSDIPWHIQLMPLNKMKVYRLIFILEEKIDYTIPHHKLTRSEAVRRYQLLSIRHPQSLSDNKSVARAAPALLPILSHENSSEAVLINYSDPPYDMVDETQAGQTIEEERTSERLAHLLSPDGPWHLAGMLKVPQAFAHTSHKHPWSFVSIKHALKLYMRVERGDEAADPKTGRKKQFDIIIETPVNILSHYCRPDWATLPRYESTEHPLCIDPADGDARITHGTPDSSQSELLSSGPLSPVVHPAHLSRPPSPTERDSPTGSYPTTPPLATTSALFAHLLHPIHSAHSISPVDDATRDLRAQTSQRFASLMAGFEDEGGELPPTYQEVTGTLGAIRAPGDLQVIQVAIPSARNRRPKTSGSGSRDQSESRSRSAVRFSGTGYRTGGRSTSTGASRTHTPDYRGPTSLFQPS